MTNHIIATRRRRLHCYRRLHLASSCFQLSRELHRAHDAYFFLHKASPTSNVLSSEKKKKRKERGKGYHSQSPSAHCRCVVALADKLDMFGVLLCGGFPERLADSACPFLEGFGRVLGILESSPLLCQSIRLEKVSTEARCLGVSLFCEDAKNLRGTKYVNTNLFFHGDLPPFRAPWPTHEWRRCLRARDSSRHLHSRPSQIQKHYCRHQARAFV